MNTLASQCRDTATRARTSAIELASVPTARKAAALRAAAARIRADVDAILAANARDVAAAPGWRVSAGPASFDGQARVTFLPDCPQIEKSAM